MEQVELEQALDILINNIKPISDKEYVSLWDANKRVLAEDVISEYDQPPFSRSPLDGFAIRSEDIKTASKEDPVKLKVIDDISAGEVSDKVVTEGTAVRLMTGAPIPDGADCVIRQEDTDENPDIVSIYKPVAHYENYCFAGEDFHVGDVLLRKGMVLGHVEIGVIAGAGRNKVLVYKRPKVALITTGDEIMMPPDKLLSGKIYNSNVYIIGASLKALGVDLVCAKQAKDDVDIVCNEINNLIDDVDLVITTGGVSVGKKDIMHDVIKRLNATRLFWRVKIKPGMPTLCSKLNNKLIISLSGNPYGSVVNQELIVRPIIAEMSGRIDLMVKRQKAVSTKEYSSSLKVRRYIRAYFEDGNVTIAKGLNDNGVISNMCGCNCFVEVPEDVSNISKGDEVTVVMML